MVRTDKLTGIIAERGKTRKAVAEAIGITPKAFGEKMKKGIFRSDEMQIMVDFLQIEDPCAIFFAQQ